MVILSVVDGPPTLDERDEAHVAPQPFCYVWAMSMSEGCPMAFDTSTMSISDSAHVHDAVIWAVNAALASERYDLVDDIVAQYAVETANSHSTLDAHARFTGSTPGN